MSGHTPGPWRYERIEKPGYCAHSYVWGPRVSIHCAGGNINGVEPDMLLIAAAPELLEALILMRDNPSDNNLNYPEVCAAILKATGGAE